MAAFGAAVAVVVVVLGAVFTAGRFDAEVVRAFAAARSAASRSSRSATAASSRCARNTTTANHAPPRRCPCRASNARTAPSQRRRVNAWYSPRSTSSFVAPAVSSAASSSTTRHPAAVVGRSRYCSSKRARAVPLPLSGT